jgi:hypothetical protein
MASAFIIFDNSQRRLTLPDIFSQLSDSIGFECAMTEWRFGESVVPQIRVGTVPPIALQLDEHPDIVPQEIQEMLDSDGDVFDEASRAAARRCRSRIEVVSCEPTQIERLREGGIVTHTPNADMDSPGVQSALRQVADFLCGWTYDNINGRWT